MTSAEQRPLTHYDRWMHQLMNRREAASLHATAGRRRVMVALHVALTAVAVAAWLLSAVGDARWATFTLLGLFLPWCFVTGVINSSTRGLLDLRVRALDERQRAERSRVAATAQRVMLWLLLAVTAAAGAATVRGLDVAGFLFPVLFTLFVVHWLMPLWVAGLSVVDEPDDDSGAAEG